MKANYFLFPLLPTPLFEVCCVPHYCSLSHVFVILQSFVEIVVGRSADTFQRISQGFVVSSTITEVIMCKQ